jgi:hypothetical protein
VHGEPDVAVLVTLRLAGVHPDPHADADTLRPVLGAEPALHQDGRRDCVDRRREHDEVAVPLGAHLVAAAGGHSLADDPPLRGQHVGVASGTEPREQRRGTLDVAEEHRESALRQGRSPHADSMPAPAPRVATAP